MAISLVPVSRDEVSRILDLDESHFIDVKSSAIAPSKLTRTLSAFANADGGELFIGVEENKHARKKTWQGFPSQEDANGHIQIFDKLFPLGEDFSYEFLVPPQPKNGLVLHVTVQKTREIKIASDGKPYIRRGAQNQPADAPDALARLQRNKGLTSFETETISVPTDIVTNSVTIIEFMLAVIPLAEPAVFLRKQQLIHDGKPVVAAVLLFSDEPQAVLPKRSSIKVYRYGTTGEGTRDTLAFNPITVEGDLYSQIGESVRKTQELIQEVKVLGEQGLEAIEYPQITLHEIITNAVLHRDYGIADDIHVRIFDNRVEIESPGRLPAHINEANILTERFSRNGAIVRMINKFPDPPNKDVGEGLNSAFAEMKKLRLAAPIIRQKENSVLVEIHHQRLGTLEEVILGYLKDHDEITNRIARELSGISSGNTVKDTFKRLAAANQIERVPNKFGNTAAWQRGRGYKM